MDAAGIVCGGGDGGVTDGDGGARAVAEDSVAILSTGIHRGPRDGDLCSV
ncbi:hypothetical protein SDC9_152879 [bioreactor metagenome]|uniref:Uncharacterized protein n=1 Tax=bioreactor metagenome TaxID=1076179 RepID=A0A645EUA8_9ZZZZ